MTTKFSSKTKCLSLNRRVEFRGKKVHSSRLLFPVASSKIDIFEWDARVFFIYMTLFNNFEIFFEVNNSNLSPLSETKSLFSNPCYQFEWFQRQMNKTHNNSIYYFAYHLHCSSSSSLQAFQLLPILLRVTYSHTLHSIWISKTWTFNDLTYSICIRDLVWISSCSSNIQMRAL